MGKKSRSKVQRQKQELAKQPVSQKKVTHNTSLIAKLQAQPMKAQNMAPKALTSTDDYSYVATDIKRILLLISISAIVLLAAVVVNSRTSLLLNLGEKLTVSLGLGS